MVRQASLTAMALTLLAACAAVQDGQPTPSTPDVPPVNTAATPAVAPTMSTTATVAGQAFGSGAVVEQFGVRLTEVRLTANGYVVDLRYRVLDPAKAKPLLDRKVRPVLVDETTGNRFYVPVPPTVGALRQTSRNNVIHTDRDYFMLFANPDRKLRAGSKVTLYV